MQFIHCLFYFTFQFAIGSLMDDYLGEHITEIM